MKNLPLVLCVVVCTSIASFAQAEPPPAPPAVEQTDPLEVAIKSAATVQPNPAPIIASINPVTPEKTNPESIRPAKPNQVEEVPAPAPTPSLPLVAGGGNATFPERKPEESKDKIIAQLSPGLASSLELDALTKERARIRLCGDFEAQFRNATLGDVLRALAEHAQMRYIAPSSDGLTATVSISGVYNILDLLDVLQDHYGASLEFGHGIWRFSKAAPDTLVLKTYQIKNNNREEVDISSPTINTSGGGGAQGGGGSNSNSSNSGGGGGGGSGSGSSSNGSFKVSYAALEKDITDLLSAPAPVAKGSEKDKTGAAATGGKVKYIAETGDLFVLASTFHHGLVQEYLAKVDQPLDQIEFSAYFVESSRDPQRELGINWDSAISVSAAGNSGNKEHFAVPRASILSAFQFAAAMKFTAQDSESAVVQNPSVLGMPNRKTVLDATTQVPYAQSSFNVGSSTASTSTSSSVERLDIGTIVNIYPIVRKTDDGKKIIRLHVSLVVSSLIGEKLIDGNPVPVTARRRFEFSAEVNESDTLAIGGLVSSSVNRVTKKVPFLGDMPLAGKLFRADSDKATRANMMVYITPRILRPLQSSLTRILPRVWPEDPNFDRPIFDPKEASLGNVRASLVGFSRELNSLGEFRTQGREPAILSDRLKGLIAELNAMDTYLATLRKQKVVLDNSFAQEINSLNSFAAGLRRDMLLSTRL